VKKRCVVKKFPTNVLNTKCEQGMVGGQFNKFKDGAIDVEHGNKGLKNPSQKSTDCTA